MTMQVVRSGPLAVMPAPEPEVRLTRWENIVKALSPKTGPKNAPTAVYSTGGAMGMVYGSAVLTRPPGLSSFRQYAQTPWIFAALNIRKDQVSTSEWDIVPFDNTKRYAARQRDRLLELFDQPTAALDSFQSFCKVVLNELLIADGAPIEKVRTPNGDIGELWPVISDAIQIDARWDGSDPETPRYYYVPDGTVRAKFKNEDMVYLMSNPRAGSPYGISPIGVLATVIESELQGLEYNRRQVMGAAPNGLLNIGESASPDDVQKAESKLRGEVFGQSALAVIGGFKSPSYTAFGTTNREMQFREWTDYLIRCIATVLGLSPMDLAITFDVNRSTAEAQGSNSDDRGLRPLMALFQSFMTREIVWDKSFGGRDNNLQFVFKSLNLDETEQKANINKIAMPGIGWKTINEARAVDGRAPIGDPTDDANVFNHVLIGTPTGIMDLNDQAIVGAEKMAQIAADAQMSVAQAQGEIDSANADKAAQNQKDIAAAAPAVAAKKPVAKADDEPLYLPALGHQNDLIKALTSVAARPISVEVHPASVEVHPQNIEVHPPQIDVHQPDIHIAPAQVTIEKGAVQVEVAAPEITIPEPRKRTIVRTPIRNADGVIESVRETEEG